MATPTHIPGVSDPYSGRTVPALLAALALPDAEGERANALEEIARYRFDNMQWYYRESIETIANYYGAQWGFWSVPESRYITAPEPRHADQVRIVCNVIKPVCDQATGILTQEPPIFKPSAGKSEGGDTAAVSAAEDFLDFVWRHHELEDLYRLSARYAFTTGTAMIHVCWDPSEGPVAEVNGELVEGGTTTKSGDLRYTMLTNDQVAPDPNARHPRDGDAIIVRERYSHSAARSRFGADVIDALALEHEAPRSESAADLDAHERATRVGPTDEAWVRNTTGQDDPLVMVYTFYLRSCPEYPRGMRLIIAAGTVVEEGENPRYPTAEEPQGMWPKTPWPIFTIIGDPRENSFWGRGRVLDLIQPQQAFNGTISKSLQHLAVISNPKVILPNNLDAEWTDEIGQVFRVGRTTDHNAIRFMQPPDLSMANYQLWDRLKSEMEYTAGVNSSTMGAAATNVESGRHADILKSGDMGRLSPVKRKMDRTWGELMRHTLQLMRRHMDDGRQLMIVGKNNATSLRHFHQRDLAAPIDITVQNDQSIPTEPVARSAFLAQLAMTLRDAGDPNTKKMLMKLHRLHDFEEFLEVMDPHQVKAERMCARILLGEPTPIFEGDDALTFKAELDGLAMTEEYEEMVKEETETHGFSPTEALLMTYWTYYTQMSAPAPMLPPEAGGAPTEGAPATEPQATSDSKPAAA
jgi:hypothetical protein